MPLRRPVEGLDLTDVFFSMLETDKFRSSVILSNDSDLGRSSGGGGIAATGLRSSFTSELSGSVASLDFTLSDGGIESLESLEDVPDVARARASIQAERS